MTRLQRTAHGGNGFTGNAGESTCTVTSPQKRLMAAVLAKALDDHRGRPERIALHPWERKAIQDAIAWVASTDRQWPFSFENICEALGFEAHALRCKLGREDRLRW